MKEVTRGNRYQLMTWLESAPDGDYIVCKQTRKRSLTANAYYWAMANRLAAALRMPLSELHENMLREYGVHEVFEVRADVPLRDYFRHYDVLRFHAGTAIVRVMKGSSQMDSAEFSRLVNGMREECEGQGIDVLTPAEIAALRFVEPEVGEH